MNRSDEIQARCAEVAAGVLIPNLKTAAALCQLVEKDIPALLAEVSILRAENSRQRALNDGLWETLKQRDAQISSLRKGGI